MNDKSITKAAAAKRERIEHFKEQTIVIDSNWKIVRFDQLNWEIQYRGKFQGYFGRLINALEAIPHKMLGEEAKNSIAEIQAAQRGILEKIEKAIAVNRIVG